MKDISLDCIPQETTAPAGDLTSQALWYQKALEELAPTRQYITYCHQQVESAWQLMQTRLLDIQRQLTEVQQIATRKPRSGNGGRRKGDTVAQQVLKEKLDKMALTPEQRASVAKLLGLTS